MQKKAIVLDLDGTLLNSQKKISPRTKKALMTAQEQGMKVILASGRPSSGMRPYAEDLALAQYNGYMIAYNGAQVLACRSNEKYFDQTIDLDIAKEILEHLKDFDVKVMINNDHYMFVEDVYDAYIQMDDHLFNIIEYESRGGGFQLQEEPDLARFLDFPLNKILVAGNPEYLQKHHAAIYAPFKEKVNGVFSAPFYFEFTDKGIDKAKALDRVFPQLGIHPENMIVFGDGLNDLSMMTYAQYSVAMGNAVSEVKDAADIVTSSNEEDGIAQVLEEILSMEASKV